MEVVLENSENTVSTGDVAVDMVVCGDVVSYPESMCVQERRREKERRGFSG